MHILGIDHIVLRSPQPERLVAFYRDVLGCAVERRVEGDAGLIQLRAGAALIDIVPVAENGRGGTQEGAAQGHNLDHFCLLVEPFDPDAIRSELALAGVDSQPPQRRYGAGGFGLSVYLRDPDGNGLELKGSNLAQRGDVPPGAG